MSCETILGFAAFYLIYKELLIFNTQKAYRCDVRISKYMMAI